MTDRFAYSIDLSGLNGDREEVVECVKAVTLKDNREEDGDTIFFTCKSGSLAYLTEMLSVTKASINISPVRE